MSKAKTPKNKIIADQTAIMLALIENNESDIDILKERILNHKYAESKSLKPAAIKLAIQHIKDDPEKFPPEIAKMMDHILIERNIGKVKDRELERTGDKTEGQAGGNLARKVPKNNERSGPKHERTHMQKDAEFILSPGEYDKGEIACEYIGSQMANILI